MVSDMNEVESTEIRSGDLSLKTPIENKFASGPLSLFFKQRLQRGELLALAEIKPSQAGNQWTVQGDEPRLCVDCLTDAPYVKITIAGEVLNDSPQKASRFITIYWDTGEGFHQSRSARLQFSGNSFKFSRYIRSKTKIHRFQFEFLGCEPEIKTTTLDLFGASKARTLAKFGAKFLQKQRKQGDLSTALKQIGSYITNLQLTPIKRMFLIPVLRESEEFDDHQRYIEWVEESEKLALKQQDRLDAEAQSLRRKPLISIVMPVYNTNPEFLLEAITSVREQSYANWELCIADDASTDPHIRPILEEATAQDSRIKVVFRESNGHICNASNSALEIASGEFIALLDHDDILHKNALYYVAKEINEYPDSNLIYSDEDKLDPLGKRAGPHFKPQWNEELFLTQNYINHLGVYRAEVLKQIGGFRPGFEGSQDHDMALRFIETCEWRGIHHIPRVLYHWRAFGGSGSFSDKAIRTAIKARQKAVQDYLDRIQPGAKVVEGLHGLNRIVRPLPDPAPLISIIIPTKDQAALLEQCVESILKKTTYANYEIIIVDNGSIEEPTHRLFARLKRRQNVSVLEYPGEFNFSAINNFAVDNASGSIMALLNNDTEIIKENWLNELVAYALLPHVGAVGAKLLYGDKRVQHAGVLMGVGGVASHSHHFKKDSYHGYHQRPHLSQYVSAVTGACLVVSKEKYLQVGGLDEKRLKVAYNDIDFCLKLRDAGFENVYCPYAVLYHHESVSRGKGVEPSKRKRFQSEVKCMQERWGEIIANDPYYNPNLDRQGGGNDFKVGLPPTRLD